MGMYTEIVTRIIFKRNLPEEVVNAVKVLVLGTLSPQDPDHEFFKCDRYRMLLTCCSHYHIPFAGHTFRKVDNKWYLSGRSDLKNYDNEIGKFFKWISPYCEAGNVIGWSLYEENDWPVVYRVNDNWQLQCSFMSVL